MKIYVLIILIFAGCLAAGCVSPVKPAAENVPAVTPSNTFTPFSNVTTAPRPSDNINYPQHYAALATEGTAENIGEWLDRGIPCLHRQRE